MVQIRTFSLLFLLQIFKFSTGKFLMYQNRSVVRFSEHTDNGIIRTSGEDEFLEVKVTQSKLKNEDSLFFATNVGYEENGLLSNAQDLVTSKRSSAKDCDSPEIDLKSFSIDPCIGEPCVMHQGTEITFRATFIAKHNASLFRCGITAEWNGIKGYIRCPEWDACTAAGVYCPLKIGKEYTYITRKKIANFVPRFFTYYIRGTLNDEKGRPFLCLETHVCVE